jgi:hypothetical protein
MIPGRLEIIEHEHRKFHDLRWRAAFALDLNNPISLPGPCDPSPLSHGDAANAAGATDVDASIENQRAVDR